MMQIYISQNQDANNITQNDDMNADLTSPSIFPEHTNVNESNEQSILQTNLNTSATTMDNTVGTDNYTISDLSTNSDDEGEIRLTESLDPKLLYREIKRFRNQILNNGKVKLFCALKKIEILENQINDKKLVSFRMGVIDAIQKLINEHYN